MAESTRHYHVLSGLHGYMPDSNTVYRTKKEAVNGARWWKAAVEDETGAIFDGTAETGYEARNSAVAGLEYIQVTDCYEPECLSELEE